MALPTYTELCSGNNVQIENLLVNKAFGEVNVALKDGKLQVTATALLRPGQGAEGWQTGVAIDCSSSMMRAFGGPTYSFARPFTESERESYLRRGLIDIRVQDGQELCYMLQGSQEEMLRDGIMTVEQRPNEVEDICRKAIPLLAEHLDADGGTTVIYWALGSKGDGIRTVADFTKDTAKTATYTRPEDMGNGTVLMPAINYFLNTFADADAGFYVFITDGHIDDFEEVKRFTCNLSHAIHNKQAKPVHMVLIGVGPDVDESQLAELDDLPDSHDLPVDIWDHKVAAEMRSILDIFSELVDENRILAPSGKIVDDQGNTAHEYLTGVPALMRFSLPATAKGFSIVLSNGATIEQRIIA